MVVSCRAGARALRWRVNGGGSFRRARDQTLWLSLDRSRSVDGDCSMARLLVIAAVAAASADRPPRLGRQWTLIYYGADSCARRREFLLVAAGVPAGRVAAGLSAGCF